MPDRRRLPDPWADIAPLRAIAPSRGTAPLRAALRVAHHLRDPLLALPLIAGAFAIRLALPDWDDASQATGAVAVHGWAAMAAFGATLLLGLRAGLAAACLGFALSMWWFVEPLGVPRVARVEDLVAGVLMLALVLVATIALHVIRPPRPEDE
jgi:K+-sensing histidine kinase KdpD